MESSGKTRNPPRPGTVGRSAAPGGIPAQEARGAPAPLITPELPTKVITPDTDFLTVAKASAKWLEMEKPQYWRMAFANPFNLTLLAGGLAASALTFNPVLAVATLGLEGLWMLHAPESGFLRRVLWDPRFAKLRQDFEDRQRNARLSILSPDARQRVIELSQGQQEIRRLAAQNPSFAKEMLNEELGKTDRLVEAFIDLSITCARYEEYLRSVDERKLANDKRRLEQALPEPPTQGTPGAPRAPEDAQTGIMRKNLEILEKRSEKLAEIHRYLEVARGQLDLISNSFQLIADQIVTMHSPHELSGQLDELLTGVETVKQTAADTEKLLDTLGS
ncbi:MAG TPA: hypothetical protein VMM92_04175 [Thermoanaerobaculia bacterium]|nr:hypothetical protein [Thermoanaerobaculia bacterium]